jgi:hypothetical protein
MPISGRSSFLKREGRFRAPEANKTEVFANRFAATELLTKNACNRLLQQNRHLAHIDLLRIDVRYRRQSGHGFCRRPYQPMTHSGETKGH